MTMAITTLHLLPGRSPTGGRGARWKAFARRASRCSSSSSASSAPTSPKIPDGGWFPLRRRRRPDGADGRPGGAVASWSPRASIVASARSPRCSTRPPTSRRSTAPAVFLFKDLGKAPPALVNNLRHNKVLHQTTLIVSASTPPTCRVSTADERADSHQGRAGRVPGAAHFGFMEEPDVPTALVAARPPRPRRSTPTTSPTSSAASRWSPARRRACTLRSSICSCWLNRGADSASRFFNLPDERVFEVGSRVEI